MSDFEIDTDRAINIFRKVAIPIREKYGDKILIRLGDMNSKKTRRGHFISCEKTKGVGFKSIEDFSEEGISKFFIDIEEMMLPLFISVTKVCIDIFDMELFLDKEEQVQVKSIKSKDNVELSDDRIVEINRLYYKE